MEYTPEAVRALAEAAAVSPDGARLLRRVVERQLEEPLTAEVPARAWVVDEVAARVLLAEAGVARDVRSAQGAGLAGEAVLA